MKKNGNERDNRIEGGAGDDILRGKRGDDLLFGGDGSDTLKGGRGDDALFGGDSTDTLKGGKGADVYVLSTSADLDMIIGFQPGVDSILYTDRPMDHVYWPSSMYATAEDMAF